MASESRAEALRIFQEEQRWIPRNFKYSCGCTLVHVACHNNNLPLLEVLDQNGFDLKSTNKNGQTPLHSAVYVYNNYSTECTEYLLKRLLGKFYIPRYASREEIVARTPDEQRDVEDTLSQRDADGRTHLLAAASEKKSQNAMLLIYNLLGPLAILENEEMVTRTELEQQQVERILSVSDNDGYTLMHGAIWHDDILELILKNLLEKYYIDGTKKPMQRTLEKQKQIAQLLLPKNNKGQTPLHYGAIESSDLFYREHLLLLRNLLGEYFVEKDGTTARPLNARSDEENQFVRELMFCEDDEGRSPYVNVQNPRNKYCKCVMLFYKANASYLLPKKCVIC
jgi:Ankyrin repeats (many copies)